jgi:hypothetical protein
MKKLFLATAGLAAVAGLTVLVPAGVGRAQQPGGKEAITIPVTQPTQPAAPGAYLPTSPGLDRMPQPSSPATPSDSASPKSLREYLSQSVDDLSKNDDIAVKGEVGQYMVCVYWYSGPGASEMARNLVRVLRGDYKLPAYVFSKGAEERKAELQRAAEYVERERKRLIEAGLPPDTKIRVPLTRYEIQVAVLVGGYKDMDAARRAAEHFKSLPGMNEPEKLGIQLHSEMIVGFDEKGNPSGRKQAYVQPLAHGMPVRNPSLPSEHASQAPTAEDMKLLRTLNADEPYSLLKCPKHYSLAVRQFSLGMEFQSKKASSTFMDKIGLGGLGSLGSKDDAAAVSAHNLAELLSKARVKGYKLETYVLHTKYCSYVLVGAFDKADDPQLLWLQQELPQLNSQLDPSIQLVARPVITVVPH